MTPRLMERVLADIRLSMSFRLTDPDHILIAHEALADIRLMERAVISNINGATSDDLQEHVARGISRPTLISFSMVYHVFDRRAT